MPENPLNLPKFELIHIKIVVKWLPHIEHKTPWIPFCGFHNERSALYYQLLTWQQFWQWLNDSILIAFFTLFSKTQLQKSTSEICLLIYRTNKDIVHSQHWLSSPKIRQPKYHQPPRTLLHTAHKILWQKYVHGRTCAAYCCSTHIPLFNFYWLLKKKEK